MAKFKMKQLTMAVGVALGGLGLMSSAQAVNLATDGLGQVLIFPYYTVRGGWETRLNVTNTSDRVVTAKVRFHEAHNSRDVFDFTLILSPHDVWTAAVIDDPATGAPRIFTNDTSCTVPNIPKGPPPGGQPFNGTSSAGVTANGTISYTNTGTAAAADGGPTSPDRMREGYVKVLMTGAAPASPNALAAGAIHGPGGSAPPGCNALVAAFTNPGGIPALRAAFPDYNETLNPLKGSYNLVHSQLGLNPGGKAVALADFYRTSIDPVDLGVIPYVPGTPGTNYLITLQLPPTGPFAAPVYTASFHEPNLNAANTTAAVLRETGVLELVGEQPFPGFAAPPYNQAPGFNPPNGANLVNFLFMRKEVINQWAQPEKGVASDWVVTHPTKRYYVDFATHQFAGQAAGRPGLPTAGGLPLPYFTNDFFAGNSCEPVTLAIYDREEQQKTTSVQPPFSPAPTEEQRSSLCKEVNVITFNGSNVLASTPINAGGVATNIGTDSLPTPTTANGWMNLVFDAGVGRAVIGFSVTQRVVAPVGTNEAFLIDHAYKRN